MRLVWELDDALQPGTEGNNARGCSGGESFCLSENIVDGVVTL
jgi:hypothetical protein